MTDVEPWLASAREKFWKAAASDNGARYWIDGDVMTVHDPAIMGDEYRLQFNLADVFRIGPVGWQ